jgi:hypothetical protein
LKFIMDENILVSRIYGWHLISESMWMVFDGVTKNEATTI